ncbi:MAG: hypothetical protein ACXWU2_07100 [Allosphingosinicella sp.]
MKALHKLNRRSFFASVVGGAAACAGLAGAARAQTGPWTGVTDSDSGSSADNAGHGRGPGGNASGQPQNRPQTGVTDGDPADPVGAGRGGQTGYSDSDSGANADPSGRGRRGQPTQTGITDRDPTDAYGQGSGTGTTTHNNTARRPDGSVAYYSGLTDTDSGQARDPSNYGRGSRDCRDADAQQPDWRNRDPVRRCE